MAKGQRKSNKEIRKPKKVATKASVALQPAKSSVQDALNKTT